jgi:hypothetical protein
MRITSQGRKIHFPNIDLEELIIFTNRHFNTHRDAILIYILGMCYGARAAPVTFFDKSNTPHPPISHVHNESILQCLRRECAFMLWHESENQRAFSVCQCPCGRF